MPLRPLNDVVIIKPDPYHTGMKIDHIVLPEENSVEKRSPYATVVSVGPRCEENWEPGDRVIIRTDYNWGRDSHVKVDGEELRLIRESYIIGRLND